jgi:hypothetical protein
LYKELLRDCRAAATEADGPGRECCRLLQEIVRPWLSVQALARADALVLLSLADCCRSAGEWLGVRRKPRRAFPGLLLAGVALALAAAAVLWRVSGEGVEEAWWKVVSWTNPLRAAVESLGDGEKIAVVGLVVIGLSLLLVSRTRGSG